MIMRLQVDRVACAGAGLCQSMSPDLFRVTRDGYAVALRTELDDPTDIVAARDVTDCCPTEAVLLTAADDGAPAADETG